MATKLSYLSKAWDHFDSGELRPCIVLLSHVSVDKEVAYLLLQACYKYWESFCWNEAENRAENLELVLESYKRILSCGNTEYMPAIGYAQLANIYIFQGAVESGLKILNLGSARGHLASIVIILQTWTVLKQLGMDYEVDKSMNFLIDVIAVEPRQERSREHNAVFVADSNLNLAFVYMHCANYVRQKCTMKKFLSSRSKLVDQFKALLAESYCLYTKMTPSDMRTMVKWFDSYRLWMDMAENLRNTPFCVLLAEESYFQALLRNHLNDEPLQCILDSMIRHKREDCIRGLLEKVISGCRWNILCRNQLVLLDETEEVPYMFSWKRKFKEEELFFSKIQARVRGWTNRGTWASRRQALIEKKSKFQETLETSLAAYSTSRDRRLLHILRLWREEVTKIKLAKHWASISIQSFWRMVWAAYCYRWMRYRIQRANYNFLVCCQLNYDTKRVMIMRKWEKIATEARKRRCAGILISSLETTKFCNRLYPGLELVLAAIAVARKYSNKRVWRHIKKLYETRRKRHARIDIRFFIRNNYKQGNRAWRKEQQAKQEARLVAAEARVAKTIRFNSVYQMRPFWRLWRIEMHKIYAARAKIRVAILLPILYARKKARDQLRRLRVRREGGNTAVKQCRSRRVKDIYYYFRRNAAACVLQRFLMSACARKILRRYKKQKRGMDKMKARRDNTTKIKMMERWAKYMYLLHREKIRAANRLRKFAILLKTRDLVRKKCQEHLHMKTVIDKIHKYFMKKQFEKLAAATVFERKRVILTPFFESSHDYQLRSGFSRWLRKVTQQQLLARLSQRFVGNKLGRAFWWNCHQSVHVIPSVDWPMTQEEHYSLGRGVDAPSRMLFEAIVTPSRVLASSQQLTLIRAFKSWMAAYRWKHRLRRMSSNAYSCQFVPAILHDGVQRMAMSLVIQCAIRKCLARKKFAHRRSRYRLAIEHFLARHGTGILTSFRRIQLIAQIQFTARRKLIQCWRQAIARRKLERQRLYHQRQWQIASYLRTSAFQKSIARKILAKFSFAYCLSRCARNEFNFGSETRFNYSDDGGRGHGSVEVGRRGLSDSLYARQTIQFPASISMTRSIAEKSSKRKRQNVKEMNDRFSKAINEIYFSPLAGSTEEGGTFNSEGAHLIGKDSNVKELSSFVKASAQNVDKIKKLSSFYSLKLEPEEYVSKHDKQASSVTMLKSKSCVQLPYNANSLNNFGSTQPNRNKFTVGTASASNLKHQLVSEFESMEFHADLFRLRQNGVFVYDTQNILLTEAEIAFFISNCHTLFCQGVNTIALMHVATSFRGSKLVLCGGASTADDMNILLSYLESSKTLIGLHINDLQCDQRAIELFLSFLLPSRASMTSHITSTTAISNHENNNSSNNNVVADPNSSRVSIQELSIDTTSLGSLGIAVLMTGVQVCKTIEILLIKCCSPFWPSSLGYCLEIASKSNYHVKELRLFGAPLSCDILDGLAAAIREGFFALTHLEFSCKSTSKEAIEKSASVLEIGRRRATSGGSFSGISITVSHDS